MLLRKFRLKCGCWVYERDYDDRTVFEFLLCIYHQDMQENFPNKFKKETKKLLNSVTKRVN